MGAESIVAVSAAVVALTQIVKWLGVPEGWGPRLVLIWSAIGVALWCWSSGEYSRAAAFSIFAGWITVVLAAAGVYGFSRSTEATLTRMTGDTK